MPTGTEFCIVDIRCIDRVALWNQGGASAAPNNPLGTRSDATVQPGSAWWEMSAAARVAMLAAFQAPELALLAEAEEAFASGRVEQAREVLASQLPAQTSPNYPHKCSRSKELLAALDVHDLQGKGGELLATAEVALGNGDLKTVQKTLAKLTKMFGSLHHIDKTGRATRLVRASDVMEREREHAVDAKRAEVDAAVAELRLTTLAAAERRLAAASAAMASVAVVSGDRNLRKPAGRAFGAARAVVTKLGRLLEQAERAALRGDIKEALAVLKRL
jgi:hypothetical protein